MPCYTTTEVKVAVTVDKWNAERTAEAIQQAGMQGTVTIRNGQLVSTARTTEQADANILKVKQKYAELTLKVAAKRFQWTVATTTTTTTGLTQLKLKRG